MTSRRQVHRHSIGRRIHGLPLTWTQVDRAAKIVRIEPGTTKNREGRTLPYDLLPELVEVIDRQWQEHERLKSQDVLCPSVFHRHGKRISDFRKAWENACTTAGCPGRIPHDFRRTAVRNLVRAGVPEKTAMQVTGHKTRSVFDRYDITTASDVRHALGQLAQTQPPRTATGQIRRFPKRSAR